MQKVYLIIYLFFISSTQIWAQQSLEDSLNKIIAQGKTDALTARAYNGLAYEYSRKDAKKSRVYLESSIAISLKIKDALRLSTCYSQLVYMLHDLGKADSAVYYLNKIKELADQADETDKQKINSNYFTVTALYFKRTGVYQKSIPFFEKAIQTFISMGDKESIAGQRLNLGNTYFAIGNYQKAMQQHLQSLNIFEEIGNQRGISFCFQSLCTSFTKLKQYQKALNYANKSLKIKTALKDRQGLGTVQSGLGDIYLNTGELDKAMTHFTTSLKIAIELNNLSEAQGNYENIAKVYSAKKDIPKAIEFLNKGKQLAIQLRDSSSIASIDAELIGLQSGFEKNEVSENKLKSSIELFKERGDLTRQATGFKNMTDFYIANNQFEEALNYNNKYYQTMDSIRNTDLAFEINKMEKQYNTDKKEKEITILKKDQLLIQASLQRQKLIQYAIVILFALLVLIGALAFNRYKLGSKMKELEIRNQIAADLHDEVGSSLSSIQMLSQMVNNQPHTDEKERAILQKMSNNAKETMDKMSDIVWMIKPGENDATGLGERIQRFLHEIGESKNIDCSFTSKNIESVELSMADRKNIYLIFKEAINNAMKYSETSKIEASFEIAEKQLVLSVKDFGKGFVNEQIRRGNGLENMQNRAKDLGAKLNINSELGIGTEVILKMAV